MESPSIESTFHGELKPHEVGFVAVLSVLRKGTGVAPRVPFRERPLPVSTRFLGMVDGQSFLKCLHRWWDSSGQTIKMAHPLSGRVGRFLVWIITPLSLVQPPDAEGP